jgi:hypothetical protein
LLRRADVDDDPARSGLRPDQLDDFVALVSTLLNLALRGLMTIPRRVAPGATPDAEMSRALLPAWQPFSTGIAVWGRAGTRCRWG